MPRDVVRVIVFTHVSLLVELILSLKSILFLSLKSRHLILNSKSNQNKNSYFIGEWGIDGLPCSSGVNANLWHLILKCESFFR